QINRRQPRHVPARAVSTNGWSRLGQVQLAKRYLVPGVLAAHGQVASLADEIDLPTERTHRPLSAAFSTVSSMRNPARRPSAGSIARSVRMRRRATPSPMRLQDWKPPLSGEAARASSWSL